MLSDTPHLLHCWRPDLFPRERPHILRLFLSGTVGTQSSGFPFLVSPIVVCSPIPLFLPPGIRQPDSQSQIPDNAASRANDARTQSWQILTAYGIAYELWQPHPSLTPPFSHFEATISDIFGSEMDIIIILSRPQDWWERNGHTYCRNRFRWPGDVFIFLSQSKIRMPAILDLNNTYGAFLIGVVVSAA